jgi:hypothetical protein
MTVLKEGRCRGPNAEPLVRSVGNARTCAADRCATRLSRYNPPRTAISTKGGTWNRGLARAATRLSRRWRRPRPTIVLWTKRQLVDQLLVVSGLYGPTCSVMSTAARAALGPRPGRGRPERLGQQRAAMALIFPAQQPS